MADHEASLADTLADIRLDLEGVIVTMNELGNALDWRDDWESVARALGTTVPKIEQMAKAVLRITEILERSDLKPKQS